jgi:flagellar M-ring protein FliF
MPDRTPAPLVGTFRSLGGTRRWITLGGALLATAAIWMLVRWAAQPPFVTLYAALPLDEAGRVADHLASAGVTYRLASGGSEIKVAATDLARSRVLLAKDGLPSAGRPGLELFDRPAWGMTDFTEQVTYRRALEGELERSIRSLQGIADAQVHLALSQTSALRRLERPAEAAVVVKLRPGVSLSADAVRGIAYLVSNSVEQLSADRVAVLDDAGHLLWIPADDSSAAGLTSRELELTRTVERQLEQKVENILAGVVGPGQSRVQVSAKLNFVKVDKTVEAYDPEGQVLQSEQHSETPAGTALDPGELPQSSVTNIYQNSRRVEITAGAVGEIERLTVAVAVNDHIEAPPGPNGAPTGTSVPLPAQTLASIAPLVGDAVGLDTARGDRLTVTAVPLSVSLVAAGLTPETKGNDTGSVVTLLDRAARPALGLLGILATLLLARRALRAGGRRAVLPALPPPASEAEAAAAAEVAAIASPAPVTDPSVLLKRRVAAESGERPDTAVRVVRAWLSEP